MKVKEDDIIWLTVVAVITVCVVLLTMLATLIMMRFEEPSHPAFQGSVLIGAGGLVLVVLWFLIKALVAHAAGYWLFKRIGLWWKERNDRKWRERERMEDDELDIPEMDEEWFKKARLTKPGESLIEKERRDGQDN